jgi:hypothetical protein
MEVEKEKQMAEANLCLSFDWPNIDWRKMKRRMLARRNQHWNDDGLCLGRESSTLSLPLPYMAQ